MKRKTRRGFLYFVMAAAGIFLFTAVSAPAAIVTGTAEITNIQYNLVNPADGTINWLDDWQGEAWVSVMDSQGGSDADYSTTPDGLGVIHASASISLASGLASVDLTLEELYNELICTIPVDGWVFGASSGMKYSYFSISPTVPGSTDPIDMSFSFDYEIHLTGQAEPGAPYYVDGSVGLKLEYEDALGDWQLVPGGQLFYSEFIFGSGTDSDDVTFSGQLQTTVALIPEDVYAIEIWDIKEVPEPTTLLLLALGGLTLLKKYKTQNRAKTLGCQ